MDQQVISWFTAQMKSFVKQIWEMVIIHLGFFMEQKQQQRLESHLLDLDQIMFCGWRRERKWDLSFKIFDNLFVIISWYYFMCLSVKKKPSKTKS